MNIPKPDGNVGVIVGRFQVNELHEGHRNLLDWVSSNYPQMIVVLGVSAVHGSRNNPLSSIVRGEMIRAEYPNAIILSLQDTNCDIAWSKNLDNQVRSVLTPNQKPVLFGSRDSFIPYYTGNLPTQELDGDVGDFWSGTQVRRQIVESPLNHNSPQFRAGVIYGSAAVYPRCIPTVDVAVFRDDEYTQVYMVRKHGETGFRFCGGYAESSNDSFEMDAKREIREEIGNLEVDKLEYVGSFNIDDWRYRTDVDKIRTTFFATKRLFGSINIQDTEEIAEVETFDLTSVELADKIVEEHRYLLQELIVWREREIR